MSLSARHIGYFRFMLMTASLLFLLVLSGCKTWPDDDPIPQPELAGTYVGAGNIGGGLTNVLMQITGPDSAGALSGAIRYRSVITSFSSLLQDSTGDTLRFRYLRNSTVYRAWVYVGAAGLTVHFEEPDDIPAFRLNREVDGYNLSGLWVGPMTSSSAQEERAATMDMDQQGQSFYGTVDVSFYRTLQFHLTSGAASVASFEMSGILTIGTTDYPAFFSGQYYAPDTVHGYWQAGSSGEVDHGEYLYFRSFE
ncbi:hypothetical protein EHM69_08350 [candidate division KSB1 bacterium]|nr:MAG: hypothetical protein EHM69_08350 [candidate division KSB1 bacterium]